MNDVIHALIAAAVTAIPVLVAVGLRCLRAWSDAQVAKIKNEDLRSRVQMAKDAVLDGVDHVGQTIGWKLREAAKDGRVTEEEGRQLREAAKKEARMAFSSDWWAKLRADLGLDDEAAFEHWLETQIESAIARFKRGA